MGSTKYFRNFEAVKCLEKLSVANGKPVFLFSSVFGRNRENHNENLRTNY